MVNETTWTHFKEITELIKRLGDNVSQIARGIDKLKSMKKEILDNAEFKAELKKIIDIYPDASMDSIVEDYQRFQALRDWLAENEYI